MKLIIGLGNPGRQYEGTRHNIGFAVLRRLADLMVASRPKAKFDGELAEARLGDEKIALFWPLTYMNLSGRAVRAATDFFGLPLPNLLVICDDFNLPLGAIRIRESGSSGGQKGLQNICETLNSQAVPRLRIGVGLPPPGWDAADYVLGKFSAEERVEADRCTETAAQAATCWARDGIGVTMTRYNGLHKSGSSQSGTQDCDRKKERPQKESTLEKSSPELASRRRAETNPERSEGQVTQPEPFDPLEKKSRTKPTKKNKNRSDEQAD